MLFSKHVHLTLSVPVSDQHPTSPYVTQNKTSGNENVRIDQTRQTTEDQMKSMDSVWENLTKKLNTTGTERVN